MNKLDCLHLNNQNVPNGFLQMDHIHLRSSVFMYELKVQGFYWDASLGWQRTYVHVGKTKNTLAPFQTARIYEQDVVQRHHKQNHSVHASYKKAKRWIIYLLD